MNWILDREQRANEFSHLSEIVDHVPVRRLIVQMESWRIDELCGVVLADALELIGGRDSIKGLSPS